MSFVNRIADPGTDIRLTVSFYQNGVLFDPVSVSDVEIYDSSVGGTLLDTITPTKSTTGIYYVDYTIPADTEVGSFLYDEWTWRATGSSGELTQRYSFLAGVVGSGDGGYSSVPSGSSLSFELRIQALETAVNQFSVILTNMARRRQLVALQGIFERHSQTTSDAIAELDVRIAALEDE